MLVIKKQAEPACYGLHLCHDNWITQFWWMDK